MNSLSLRLPSRRTGYVAATFMLLFATITSAFASAAQIQTRSIALSTSTAGATSVNYQVKFTATQTAGAVVIDFCHESPLIGSACTAPTGLNLSSATVSGSFTKDSSTASKIIVSGTVTAGVESTIDIANVTNPTTANETFYARILTYTDATDAGNYASTDPDNGGANIHKDDGGVALSTTSKIGVSADVLESLTFCVSAAAIADNCGGTLTAPTLKLGQDVGGVTALTTNISTGDVFTQISTNAVSGAIVSLKSNTLGCGGLSRAGAASFAAGCGIAPSLATDVTAGSSKFGVKTATATGGTGANGEFRPYDSGSGAFYNATNYKMNWVSGDASGVTSTYGDPFLDTHSLPVNNMNMQLTFAAAAANNTPAGSYSADLSLIATGKF